MEKLCLYLDRMMTLADKSSGLTPRQPSSLIYSVEKVLQLVTSLNSCAPHSEAASKQRDSEKMKLDFYFFFL